MLDLLMTSKLPPDQHEFLRTAYTSSRQMLRRLSPSASLWQIRSAVAWLYAIVALHKEKRPPDQGSRVPYITA